MKKIFIVLLVFALVGSACNQPSNDAVKFVKCLVNGVQWQDDGTSYINKNTNTLAVSGSTSEGTLIVAVKNVTGTGTYSLTTADGVTTLSFQRTEGGIPVTYSIMSSRASSHGTLTVTRVTAGTSVLDYIEGNFSGVAYTSSGDSVVITNGQFSDSR